MRTIFFKHVTCTIIPAMLLSLIGCNSQMNDSSLADVDQEEFNHDSLLMTIPQLQQRVHAAGEAFKKIEPEFPCSHNADLTLEDVVNHPQFPEWNALMQRQSPGPLQTRRTAYLELESLAFGHKEPSLDQTSRATLFRYLQYISHGPSKNISGLGAVDQQQASVAAVILDQCVKRFNEKLSAVTFGLTESAAAPLVITKAAGKNSRARPNIAAPKENAYVAAYLQQSHQPSIHARSCSAAAAELSEKLASYQNIWQHIAPVFNFIQRGPAFEDQSEVISFVIGIAKDDRYAMHSELHMGRCVYAEDRLTKSGFTATMIASHQVRIYGQAGRAFNMEQSAAFCRGLNSKERLQDERLSIADLSLRFIDSIEMIVPPSDKYTCTAEFDKWGEHRSVDF